MGEQRQNRDFSKGPVWDPTSRWLVDIRYQDGSRFRKRLRREREALRLWATEQARLDNGTWDERAARNVTLAEALKQYREYSKVQHRLPQHLHRSLADALGAASGFRDATREDQLAADRRLQAEGRTESDPQYDRQGSGDTEGVLHLVHRPPAGRVEPRAASEAIPR